MSIHQEQVRPAVVIEIKKHCTPPEILRVGAETGGKSHVRKRAVSVVVVESGGVVGKVRFENVRTSIAIVVGNGGAHARLFAPVLIEGNSAEDGCIGKSAVTVIVVKNAGSAVAGDIDIRPAVVVVVQSRDAETIVARRMGKPGALGCIREPSTALIVVEHVTGRFEPARPAHDRSALPETGRVLARKGRRGNIEIYIVCDNKILQHIAVVVDKRAACAPLGSVSSYACGCGNFLESPIPFIVVEPVLSIVSDIEVLKAVIVVVAGANSLAPSAGFQTGLFSNVSESAIVVVMVKMIAGLGTFGKAG